MIDTVDWTTKLFGTGGDIYAVTYLVGGAAWAILLALKVWVISANR